ncbi:PAX3- and PAX7-binding protein 1 [Lingula anatina]|uniref:PAX3- and PAX7-binding protein 1 n=1 Tax=Lingula anatina TaxID=7574 RepID=A0A1S3HN87_LINAN|nr:PAX3- and PAX7-binding protein 1 [Lingula anatina]|eukprot:XP_013387497.1 PAX3- and PAX7-binding protein 1 [Lingula anatina]
MASTFRKPKRNFRRKVEVNDSEDEENSNLSNACEAENNEDSSEVPETAVVKKEKKKKSGKSKVVVPASILSFEDENEEGEVFKVKKPSHSRRVAKQLKKERKKEKEEQEKIETKEKEQELKKEKTEDGDIYSGDDMDVDSNGEDSEGDKPKRSGGGAHVFKAVLERGEIPDAHLIHMARKRRQMAREMGDVIPLDDTVKVEKANSRLVRDDENDVSDEEEERIDFTVNTLAKERQKIKDDFLAAEHGSDDSDHEREWEEQQIRKGVSLPQIQSNQQPSYSYDQYYSQSAAVQDSYSSSSPSPYTAQGAINGSTPAGVPAGFSRSATYVGAGDKRVGPPKELPPITVGDVTRRLKERLESLQQVHRARVLDVQKMEDNIKFSESTITKCEGDIGALEERYKFFQEMRGYVRDLVECLNEKVPAVNALEASMLNCLKQRAEKLVKRRQEDVKDQSQEYITNKSSTAQVPAVEEARQRRVAEREARRARRRRARQSQNIANHHEGLSSDDEESQLDITKAIVERDRIRTESQKLFEDVVDEFCKLKLIKARFEEWKDLYGDTYNDAYIGLCLPKLFSPLIRLDLIEWNPLQVNCPDFEEMRWYETLMFYGYKEGQQLEDSDQDLKLLPTIVDKILLSRIKALVEDVWDPMSSSETTNLVRTVRKLATDYPSFSSDSKNTQALVQAVVKRMRKTLDDDVFMPLYPKQVLEDRKSGACAFFNRQMWTCIKLLNNILKWSGICDDGVLQEMALDSLLNRYIMLGLSNSEINSSTLEKVQVITSTFPKDWFSGLQDDNTLPQLQSLCRFLVHAANSLDKKADTGKESDKKETRDLIKQVSKLLVNIHALDHALSLASQFGLRI